MIYQPSMGTEADPTEAPTDKDADSTFFKGDVCGPIAASVNESMFQLVISKWRYAYDSLKETHDYKFLSAAGSLMKNMVIISLLSKNTSLWPKLFSMQGTLV